MSYFMLMKPSAAPLGAVEAAIGLHWSHIVVCVALWAFHLLTKWNESFKLAKLEKRVPPSFLQFYSNIMPTVLMSIFGTISAFLLVDGMGWMNAGMAGACGYMGSSVTKKLVDQFQGKIGA